LPCEFAYIKTREFRNEVARKNAQTQQQKGNDLSGIMMRIGEATSLKQSLLEMEQAANCVLTATLWTVRSTTLPACVMKGNLAIPASVCLDEYRVPLRQRRAWFRNKTVRLSRADVRAEKPITQ
jgi:hypothetical protein